MQKTALVTGGTRGIGRGIALQLATDGFNVAACYKSNTQAAMEVKHEIEKMGRQAHVAPCDAADLEAVRAFVTKAEDVLGSVDVLVNNAGIVRDRPLVMMSPEEWHDVIDTNLTGVFNFCRATIFIMSKRQKGNIINLSSLSGVYGNATQTNYSASKAGIIGFSKALSKEVGRSKIRVNVVAPGFIETDITSGMSEKRIKEIKKKIALGRIGRVDDVAHLISFLASDKSVYITGQVFVVDGGLVI